MRKVDEPTPFPHRHPSSQPFLTPLEETAWHPARRLAPDRPRRKCAKDVPQEPLFADDAAVSTGGSAASSAAAPRAGCRLCRNLDEK